MYNGREVMRVLGLWISRDGSMTDEALQQLLAAQMIPLAGMTEQPSFAPGEEQADFLRGAAAAILRGESLPMEGIARHLSGREALAGNVLRKYVFLQLSLAPYLRVNPAVTELAGCFLLGESLLVAPMGQDGCVDAALPPGVWTELSTGECVSGHLRRMRGLNAMPVLARENSVIPIGVNDRTANADDADRVTLHWFQPEESAACTLADGTSYHLTCREGTYTAHSDATKPWHLIVHQNGEEILMR